MPDVLNDIANTPEMLRLSDIGMHCGCEYTSVPIYSRAAAPYSRLTHSIGVAGIVWHFTHDIKQAVAGLLHDIATPVFAHTIDFMNNDHMTQESTEEKTLAFIKDSESIMALLERHSISVEEVSDYHIYPIADNDTPMLSADRLEYTFGNISTIFNEPLSLIEELYSDLSIGENELGKPELCFLTYDKALEFTRLALRNSYFYVTDSDRFSMQYLSDIIRNALGAGILVPDDLFATERDVIGKLKAAGGSRNAWDIHSRISKVSTSPAVLCDRYCVNVSAKKRYIDPLVMTGIGCKRLSDIDAGIGAGIQAFLDLDFNYWLFMDEPQRL